MTTTINTIATLNAIVLNANTAIATGRQAVANSCKQLYDLIELDVFKSGNDWMLNGMYNDLCNGNFAEPFMCELKKTTFATIVAIYNERVLPRI